MEIGEDDGRAISWRAEVGRELARQCPSLLVLALLVVGITYSNSKALDRLRDSIDRLSERIYALERN